MTTNDDNPTEQPQRSTRPAYELDGESDPKPASESQPAQALFRLLGAAALACVFVIGFSYSTGWSPTQLFNSVPDLAQEKSGRLASLIESQLDEASQQSTQPEQTGFNTPPLTPYLAETSEELIAECIAVGEHLVTTYAENVDAKEMLARAEYEFGSADNAKKLWTEILDAQPNYVYALQGLGDIATLSGELSEAVTYYRRAVIAQPTDLSRQFTLANGLISAGELDEAIEVLDGMIKLNPGDGLAFLRRGQALAQKGDHQQANEAFLAASEALPENPDAQLGLAQTYVRLGNREKAKIHQELQKTLTAAEQENATSETQAYDDLEALRSDIAKLYTDMARVYFSAGQARNGRYILQRACRMNPLSIEPRQALSWISLQENQQFAAARWLSEVAALRPKELSYAAEMARIYTDANQLASAERTLLNFIEGNPDNAEGKALLSRFYTTAQSDPAKAIDLARQAAEESQAIQPYVWLASLLENAGETSAALEAYVKANELGEESPTITQKISLLKTQLEQATQAEEKSAQSESEPKPSPADGIEP